MTGRFSYRGAVTPITVGMATLFLTLPAPAFGAAPTLDLRDGSRAVLQLENAKPGDVVAGCLSVVYRGEGPARLRLYGQTHGTGFDRYLDLVVERGGSCDSLHRSAVVYRGRLARFPNAAARGLVETWSPGESRAYRFRVTVRDDNAAQGLSARQAFVWTATTDDVPAEAEPGRTEAAGGGLPTPPGAESLRELLKKIAKVAAEVGKRSAFPSSLLFLVGIFLAMQNRIDRRDPKLALAPVYPTPDLSFSPPEAEGDTQ